MSKDFSAPNDVLPQGQEVEEKGSISLARSALMARVRRANTTPEIRVRRLLHSMGYRFRLHRRDLPGTPDLVLPRLKKAFFVHGCFWHRHPGCRMASSPKTREEFWQKKFRENVERDKRKAAELSGAGWDVAIVWECETRDLAELEAKLVDFLGDRRARNGLDRH